MRSTDIAAFAGRSNSRLREPYYTELPFGSRIGSPELAISSK
jgi:hypothetical protein